MRLSLRFILPLAIALAAIAYAVIPLVDRFTLQWFVRDLETCGITLAKLSDLNARASELNGLILEVQLKTTTKPAPNGETKSYQNCYINKCHGGKPATTQAQASGAQAGTAQVQQQQQQRPAAPTAPVVGKKPTF